MYLVFTAEEDPFLAGRLYATVHLNNGIDFDSRENRKIYSDVDQNVQVLIFWGEKNPTLQLELDSEFYLLSGKLTKHTHLLVQRGSYYKQLRSNNSEFQRQNWYNVGSICVISWLVH